MGQTNTLIQKTPRKRPVYGVSFGADSRTRTDDLLITNELLYRISIGVISVETRRIQPLVCHLFVLKIAQIGLRTPNLQCSEMTQNRVFSHFTKDHIRCAD